MNVLIRTTFVILPLVLMSGCSRSEPDRVSSAPDETAGETASQAPREWRPLFDGRTLDGWRGLGRDGIPEGHWIVEDGSIRKVKSGDVPLADDGQPMQGGDILTEETFADFEFSFEWKVSPAGNTGVKYNVSEEMSTAHDPPHAALGFEYQVLDDDGHPDGEDPTHRAAALYDLIAPNEKKSVRPVGEWNTGRIVLAGNRGEHWLNGDKVLEYELGTASFDSLYRASKYAPVEGFADRRRGHIVLQDHTDDVWFRNLKIREIDE